MTRMVTKEQVIEALKKVEDPELFLDIWFLGLIYNIGIEEDETSTTTKVTIDMTFTSPMCPAGPALIDDVQTKIKEIEGVSNVHVNVVFSPPWQPSEEVRLTLGLM